MKRHRIKLLTLLTIAPIGLLVFYKINNPSHQMPIGPPPPGAKLATSVNPQYIQQQKEWADNEFELFNRVNILSGLSRLYIKYEGTTKGEVDITSLRDAASKFLNSLLANSFDAYLAERTIDQSPFLDGRKISRQEVSIKRLESTNDRAAYPLDIHKQYWLTVTENGKLSQYWQQISWPASWIQFERIFELDDFTNIDKLSIKLMTSVPNCGIVPYSLTFLYRPSPEEVIKENQHIVSALCYFLERASDHKDYPLILRFYWAPSTKTWLPTYLAVGFVGLRELDPVF